MVKITDEIWIKFDVSSNKIFSEYLRYVICYVSETEQ